MKIDIQSIVETFAYDESKKGLVWKKVPMDHEYLIGKRVGRIKKCRGTAQVEVQLNGEVYLEHRLVFLIFNGFLPKNVYHINGDNTDNRIENLTSIRPSRILK